MFELICGVEPITALIDWSLWIGNAYKVCDLLHIFKCSILDDSIMTLFGLL